MMSFLSQMNPSLWFHYVFNTTIAIGLGILAVGCLGTVVRALFVFFLAPVSGQIKGDDA